MADAALRSFRAEAVTNRSAVAKVKDYHIDRMKALGVYLAAVRAHKTGPDFPLGGLQPRFFQHTAGGVSLGTPSLADNAQDPALQNSPPYNNPGPPRGP